jgi:hypothetical protein
MKRPLFVTLAAAAVLLPATPAAADTVHPGTYAGLGFDTCTAPTSATMQAWLQSPYRALGIYFGGTNRACLQPQLTAQWVEEQTAAGWHLMPIYLGPQASCTESTKPNKIDNTRANAQGQETADDAVVQARAIGLARESVLIYDMEAYATNNAACRAGVLAFMSGWTARLHDHGYLSGFYSSMRSGMADQINNYNAPGFVRPDYVDFARWDEVPTVLDDAIPSGYWWPQRRMKQYRGDHIETWGTVPINIDNDILDVAPLPAAGFSDITGNGWSDLLARTTTGNGSLLLLPGNGTALDPASARTFGSGWNTMSALLRIGDLNADGHEDVLAREASTGVLWFYPGRTSGLGIRQQIGTGWNGMRELTPIGDFDRDGFPDLLAVNAADKKLYLYPGRPGVALGTRVVLGNGGWDVMSELAGVGDFDRDGFADMVARSAAGTLYLYRGRVGGFHPRTQIGTGWTSMRDLVGVGDFNRDGFPDLTAVNSVGGVYLYQGTGTGLTNRTTIATGFTNRTPLF